MGLFKNIKSGWDDAVSKVSDTVTSTGKALYDASLPKLITTGHNTITDKAGELWSKAVDDTGISKTVGDAITGAPDAITGAIDTVKDTAQNVVKGVSDALPIIAIGAAAVLGLALLFGRH